MSAVATKSLADVEALARDEAFWNTYQLRTLPRVADLFLEIMAGGVEAAIRVMKRQGYAFKADGKREPPPEYIELMKDPVFTARLQMEATAHATTWYRQLESTTRSSLIETIVRSREEGWSLARTAERVGDIFGPQRAQRIAVTETTRLFGSGSQHAYREFDVQRRHWRTAEDGRVDPECDGMAAGGPYPMFVDFIPVHVNCRCWPAPVSSDEAAKLGAPKPEDA